MDYTVLSRIDSVGDQLFRLPSIEEDQPLSPTFVNQSSFVANIASSFAGADDVFLRGETSAHGKRADQSTLLYRTAAVRGADGSAARAGADVSAARDAGKNLALQRAIEYNHALLQQQAEAQAQQAQ